MTVRSLSYPSDFRYCVKLLCVDFTTAVGLQYDVSKYQGSLPDHKERMLTKTFLRSAVVDVDTTLSCNNALIHCATTDALLQTLHAFNRKAQALMSDDLEVILEEDPIPANAKPNVPQALKYDFFQRDPYTRRHRSKSMATANDVLPMAGVAVPAPELATGVMTNGVMDRCRARSMAEAQEVTMAGLVDDVESNRAATNGHVKVTSAEV